MSTATYCTGCGTALPGGARFCGSCGVPAQARAASAPLAALPPAVEPIAAAAPAPAPAIHNTVVVVGAQKSVGVAILLTILFGPLGMFYSTVTGALVMLVVTFLAALVTFGLGILITWPICVIWGAIAASNHNAALVAQAGTVARV
jgi:hypothetical protein